ncbi:hypothetical protein B0J18DRAFT_456696 [Chaetomium sp. MPI-SDFR-AT-0129]|nr:hypothetical protein B0J18DRAFT_456696 [Chaetomium sp. MPI-SDFR-AT-0129]
MPDYKGVLKSAGERGSALKGQVKSKIGRGEDNTSRYENHTSAPLASLRDPASFAPPPKRNPNAVIGVPSPTTSTGTTGPPIPSRPGTFADSTPEQEEPAAPPKPWRLDTTGLSTSHLPPPPGRKDGANTRSPPPVPPNNNTTHRPGPPGLPPRLPPRSSNPSSPATGTPSPPPPYSSPTTGPALPTRHKPQPSPTSGSLSPATSSPHLNQSAISRLSAAGVSVPGLGIGRGNANPTSTTNSTTAPALEDVRAAADAVNAADGFRRKHGEQVGAGVKALGGLQGRFGGVGGGEGNGTSVGSGHGSGSGIAGSIGNLAAVSGKKKPPPPPPPKKKPGLGGGSRGDGEQEHDEPPPIPMATRPQF